MSNKTTPAPALGGGPRESGPAEATTPLAPRAAGAGSGHSLLWPDPARPGVPASPHQDGWHWLSGTPHWWQAQAEVWRSDRAAVRTAGDVAAYIYGGPCPMRREKRVAKKATISVGQAIKNSHTAILGGREMRTLAAEVERLRAEVASLRLTLGGRTYSADVPEPIGCPMPGACAQVAEIGRLRNVIRVNALRWNPALSHEQIDEVIHGKRP